ncbi:MAG: ankyrin repeat domain-containing protein [Cetobacterium sp.]
MKKVINIILPDDAEEFTKNLYDEFVERDILKGNLSEALRLAAQRDCTQMVQILLDAGVDIHQNNNEALRYAIEHNAYMTAKLLIDNGANIHSNYEFALRMAARNGNLGMVKLLYETHRAQIKTVKFNALENAIKSENIEIAEYFLTKEKKLSKDIDSMLLLASSLNLTKSFEFLLTYGADISINYYKIIVDAIDNKQDDILEIIIKDEFIGDLPENIAESLMRGELDEVKSFIKSLHPVSIKWNSDAIANLVKSVQITKNGEIIHEYNN